MSYSTLVNQKEQPLHNIGVLVTRAAKQASALSLPLQALGAKVIELPVLEIIPPQSWQSLDKAIEQIETYDWVIFASTNAVESFISRAIYLNQLPSLRSGKPLFAAIGDATASIATAGGLKISFKPPSFVAEALVKNFPGYPNLSGIKILWPRTNIGRNYISDQLAAAGANVHVVSAYRTELPSNWQQLSLQFHTLIEGRQIQVITLGSRQTAINLAKIIGYIWQDSVHDSVQASVNQEMQIPSETSSSLSMLTNLLEEILIVSIGPETTLGSQKYLGKVDLEASPHTHEGIVQALIKHFAKSDSKSDRKQL